MKRDFVLIRRRGAGHFEMALGHDTPPRQKRDFIKRLRTNKGDTPYDEVVVARVVRAHRLTKRTPGEETRPQPKPKKVKEATGLVAAVKKATAAAGDFLMGK